MLKDVLQRKGFSQRRFGRKNSAGFTLVEILVVSFIIGLIAVTLIVSLRESNKESNLRFAAQNLVSVLKQAQTHTSSGKTIGGDVPAGGYGVYVQATDSYILFADKNDNGNYNSGEEVEIINLPEAIEFFGGALPGARIIFYPPEGSMSITTGAGDVDDLIITLRITDDISKTAQIYINSLSGLIEMRE